MKHAILVGAHGDFRILKLTMKILDHENIDFFIHVDAKSQFSEDEFNGVCVKSRVTLIPRIKVYWGDYSQIQMELSLLKTAVNSGYDYYHMISGADLPIKTAAEFLAFFENKGSNVDYVMKWEYYPYYHDRVNYRYPFLKYYHRHKNKVINLIMKGMITRALKVPVHHRKKPLLGDWKVYAGNQWFSMTHRLTMQIITREEWIEQVFNHGYTVDEAFVQTILFNSPELVQFQSDFETRLIDWKRGRPYVWRIEDLPEILKSEALFCRKFDMNVDSCVVEAIGNYLLNEKNS